MQSNSNFNVRPSANNYSAILKTHLARAGTQFTPFIGQAVPPRQLEIHLSNKTGVACNLRCNHCQGRELSSDMRPMGDKLFSLVDNLQGRIPMFIISGLNSEPTLNVGLIGLIERIKRTGSNFGLHTNAVLLLHRQKAENFISRIVSRSCAKDYISVSLDAAKASSYSSWKAVPKEEFDLVVKGIRLLTDMRQTLEANGRSLLRIRLTYLLNSTNCSPTELNDAVKLAVSLGVDSLRFSVPYAPFGLDRQQVMIYRQTTEFPLFNNAWKHLKKLVSTSAMDRPLIFALPPNLQDVMNMTYTHCFFGYFMMALGMDGFFYRCSAIAHPMFEHLRLGSLTDNIEELCKMILRNQDEGFNPQESCMAKGARCNRGAIEINSDYETQFFPDQKGVAPHVIT